MINSKSEKYTIIVYL